MIYTILLVKTALLNEAIAALGATIPSVNVFWTRPATRVEAASVIKLSFEAASDDEGEAVAEEIAAYMAPYFADAGGADVVNA